MQVKFKPIDSDIKLPEKAHEKDAGYDLRAYLDKSIVLYPLERSLISTGLYIELPPNFEAQIRPRSGLANKYGITVLNSPGTIDEPFRGIIHVLLINLGKELFIVENKMKIAQMVFSKLTDVTLIMTNEELSTTDRGDGGFGSTGEK